MYVHHILDISIAPFRFVVKRRFLHMQSNPQKEGLTRTREAVARHIAVLKSPLYEIGLFRPSTGDGQPEMLPRTWDAKTLITSIPWLRWQNSRGRNIYMRPAGEHAFSLIDDLTPEAVRAMKQDGFAPSLVVETSPQNLQAWVNHGQVLPRNLSTLAARALAQRFGGDPGAADWRHFGRLSGFTNRKPKHQGPDGLFPFVHLMEARQVVYAKAGEFIAALRDQLAHETGERLRSRKELESAGVKGANYPNLTIDDFRQNPRYADDGNRIDLAYAVYALSHGATEREVAGTIAGRDLSKKGSEKRQQDYVDRTLDKARAACGQAAQAANIAR